VAAIPEDCHLCTEISKRRTIMQATVNTKKNKKLALSLGIQANDDELCVSSLSK
jgi:hypothetical protein